MLTVRLPDSHYRDAFDHESKLIALMLIDRKLTRRIAVDPEWIVDSAWRVIYKRLAEDAWMPLAAVVSGVGVGTCRLIAETIVDPFNGRFRCFEWNARWHAAEIERLAGLRLELTRIQCFIQENCEC